MSKPILNVPTPNQHKLDILRQHFPQAVEVDAQGRIRINAAALQQTIDLSNPAGIQVEEDGYELHWVGKDLDEIAKLIRYATTNDKEALVLDFFGGSGTTGEAVMRLNAEDGGNRQFILVQIPQLIDPKGKKQKEAHTFVTETLGKLDATIFEITAEHLRRAGAKIETEQAAKAQATALQPAHLEPHAGR